MKPVESLPLVLLPGHDAAVGVGLLGGCHRLGVENGLRDDDREIVVARIGLRRC